MTALRLIPSIDELLQRPALAAAAATHGPDRTAQAARIAAGALREGLKRGDAGLPATEASAAEWLEAQTLQVIRRSLAPSLCRVINATGVILHTNLGRAPIAAEALARAAQVATGYANLEYDLEAGRRGRRHVHAERLLCDLTGGEAALVVNNNAAAVLLVLAALASGREVIVSRGELVEIGGGFRVPDVLAQSGATLREVGTTNRTRVNDYAAAIGERTALVLRVHPSNFRIEGFTARPTVEELAALTRRFGIPLVDDLGSGWLGSTDERPAALGQEPAFRDSLEAGADLVTSSGDKLLGGPQAGLIVGRRRLMEALERHPLMRAVRADKVTYALLEATLTLWAQAPARPRLPVYRMLMATADEIGARALRVADPLRDLPGVRWRVIDGVSTTGGGSAPESALPTRLLVLQVDTLSAAELEARLRHGDPPVVARIQDDAVVIDLRTVMPEEEDDLARAVRDACRT